MSGKKIREGMTYVKGLVRKLSETETSELGNLIGIYFLEYRSWRIERLKKQLFCRKQLRACEQLESLLIPWPPFLTWLHTVL